MNDDNNNNNNNYHTLEIYTLHYFNNSRSKKRSHPTAFKRKKKKTRSENREEKIVSVVVFFPGFDYKFQMTMTKNTRTEQLKVGINRVTLSFKWNSLKFDKRRNNQKKVYLHVYVAKSGTFFSITIFKLFYVLFHRIQLAAVCVCVCYFLFLSLTIPIEQWWLVFVLLLFYFDLFVVCVTNWILRFWCMWFVCVSFFFSSIKFVFNFARHQNEH